MQTIGNNRHCLTSLLIILSFLINACKKNEIPVLSTLSVLHIANTSAWSGGTILSDGGSLITERGVCWNTLPGPTISSHIIKDQSEEIKFTCFITGLSANTKYFVRAYATSSSGTGYGNEESFTTADYETNIPKWLKLTSSSYCWYYNDSAKFKPEYGALYNWYAVNSGKLSPAGWHVPDVTEWNTLFNNLGGLYNSGGKLKEADTTHWMNPNYSATNESDFNALPGGRTMNYREIYNPGYFVAFIGIGSEGYWWSSDEYSESHGMYFKIKNTSAGVESGNTFKTLGFSVRCLKDHK